MQIKETNMKTDIDGQSTTEAGQEQYEQFYSVALRRQLVQYDYRTMGGELFSCVTGSLEKARAKRDRWLNDRGVVK
jgi:hypothetical protein